MSLDAEKRYMDVAFFNIGEKSAPPEKKNRPLITILATVAATLVVIAVAYCAGWRAGVFAAPCCLGPIDLQFEFDG
ncbi:hypothetical protein [Hyphococcus sp.]|uniref:hypothetical protein n=1 Tax=Hyphococcus sp. TaxID=2038636 RepID=UPI0035C73BEB